MRLDFIRSRELIYSLGKRCRCKRNDNFDMFMRTRRFLNFNMQDAVRL